MTTTPEDLAGAVLTIDLVALKSNWQRLDARAGSAECGAAVKGNAYGLGIEPVARTLWEAGCRSYFVARPVEGEELRAILPEATIYVLDGLFQGQAEYYAKLDLCPALISTGEAKEWAAFGRVYGRKLPCAIHVDTGINRLGFSIAEFNALLEDRFTIGAERQPADEPPRLRRRAIASAQRKAACGLRGGAREASRHSGKPRQFRGHLPGGWLHPRSRASRHRALWRKPSGRRDHAARRLS